MLIKNGNQQLQDFDRKNFKKSMIKVTDGVWHTVGFGHSNAIFIEANTSVLLIDTLDTLERGEALRKTIQTYTTKEIKTIIYTHEHPDHRGGAGAFQNSNPEIIAFTAKNPPLEKSELLKDIQMLRGTWQFGYTLTDKEALSQGIGPREGITIGEHRAFLSPTTLYQEDHIIREIDGIELEMVRLPGEAEDQIMIWLPQKKVVCCGDNYFGCFPNLYAIRGGQYRNLATWISSIETLLSYPAQYLLPGHTAPIIGYTHIQEVLGKFKDAIDYLLTKTLEAMNTGKSPDQLAAEIKLPAEYEKLPVLAEHYGCVEWTVREIYAAYLGWFDGNPTHLHPLPPKTHAYKTMRLMGGQKKVYEAAKNAFQQEDYQWCLELCDLIITVEYNRNALALKASALEKLAEYETSANGRHYYIASAKDIKSRIENK